MISNRGKITEALLHQGQTTLACSNDVSCSLNRIGVAIKSEYACVGRCENGARIAACTKSAVDIKTALAQRECIKNLIEEHRNVSGRSANSESSVVAVARFHSRAPRGYDLSVVYRALSCFRRSRTRLLASSRCARNLPGSQI